MTKWWTIRRLKSNKPQTRREAVVNLAAQQQPESVRFLLPLAADPDGEVRKSVVEALGQSRNEQVLTPLFSALHDPDTGVREAAVMSLTQLADARAIDPLMTRDERFHPAMAQPGCAMARGAGVRRPVSRQKRPYTELDPRISRPGAGKCPVLRE